MLSHKKQNELSNAKERKNDFWSLTFFKTEVRLRQRREPWLVTKTIFMMCREKNSISKVHSADAHKLETLSKGKRVSKRDKKKYFLCLFGGVLWEKNK